MAALAMMPACGGDDGDGDGDPIDASEGDGDGSTTVDAPEGTVDAPPGAVDGPPGNGGDGPTGGDDGGTNTGDGGTPLGDTQCSNGNDDDGDGAIDGFDPQCTSAADNDEGSFATGISGDNMDPVKQDCFFDGDSGHGNDCEIHVCCLLDDPTTPEEECPADLKPGQYDPAQCDASQDCIDYCAPQSPPGCDCFGCCTICNEADECQDVLLEASCDPNDFSTCTTCTKVEECSTSCEDPDMDDCVLCPGQDESDLPDSCMDMNTCPEGQQACDLDTACPVGQFCANGCCIASNPE